MNKQHLAAGTLLRYTGKLFKGFDPEMPHTEFLGYDSNGWTDIWIKYKAEIRLISLSDVEVVVHSVTEQ
ncbi:hypothetical protein MTO98_15055 [Mucilaginibacter sp. SMC90]|uniref:hypothetical protein n=1 Tax=Mucilaginibacter sp. SMC90 TaxID=2929803 RepID=UPI001FB1D432|nr:hypothetical protein [Mucilaginibacter sp. SMC90]UOE52393.1 hypothetical protein MTO98_15055 [Mucilaginibacter sp. SMC90]